MANVVSFCRACQEHENANACLEGNFKLRLCTNCNMVAYCSRECQRSDWKNHRPHCLAVAKLVNPMGMGQNLGTSAQRRSVGTSADTDRVNEEAERLAQEALVHKRACRYDMAFHLYTKALLLDPFNHWYFHHRAETLLLVHQHFKRPDKEEYHLYLGLAILDAQSALDLAPMCHEPWLVMIRSAMEQRDLDSAMQFLDMALHVVPKDASEVRQALIGYKAQVEEMQMSPMDFPKIVITHDNPDDLYYMYTNGMHNYGRTPELIAVDLKMSTTGGPSRVQQMIKWVILEALGGSISLSFGDVYEVPNQDGGSIKTWVIPIPVSSFENDNAEEGGSIRLGIIPLMGMAQAASDIVVLKIVCGDDDEDAPPEAMSKEQAKNYLRAIVNNSENVRSFYKRDMELASTGAA